MSASRATEPSAAQLAETIQKFLAANPAATLLEDGRVAFDLRTAQCRVGESHGRCLLELWSEERNLVRTVVDVQKRAHCLRLATRRMGTTRAQTLELVGLNERRAPTTRDKARRSYQRILTRALERRFPQSALEGFRAAMDLEHSFGPSYVRGQLKRGSSSEAVVGVGGSESAAMVDGALTIGLLWLDYCRQRAGSRQHVGGLKLVVPAGLWRTAAERMLWMNHAMAGFELYTLDEQSEELTPMDYRDAGNLASRLVHAFSHEALLERSQTALARLFALLPAGARERVEIRPNASTELGLALHGLEFARIRRRADAASFGTIEEIAYGAGSSERLLTEDSEAHFVELTRQLFRSRHADGDTLDPLFRMQPERWLESALRRRLAEILPGLIPDRIYAQVPAIGPGERGMLDLLTVDQSGRLLVLEIKANEDMRLPLQALDYWIRVHALNAARTTAEEAAGSAFRRAGYFPGVELSPLPPRLAFVAPALRIHPSNEIVLRYFSPEIDWELLALGEQWRRELKVVFRKRGGGELA